MNNFGIIIVIIASCLTTHLRAKDCTAIKERAARKCTSLTPKYQQACVEKRLKRSSCYTICESCNCDQCLDNQCDCNSCCASIIQPCTTRYCCYRRCYKDCDTIDCRRDCRSDCTQTLSNRNTTQTKEETVVANLQSPQNNVTTIINIHTQMNDTKKIEPVYTNVTNTYNIIPPNMRKKVKCCEVLVQKCEPNFYPYFRITCRYEKEYDCGDICLKEIMKESGDNNFEFSVNKTIEEVGGSYNSTEIETQTEVLIEPQFDVFTPKIPDVPAKPNITHGHANSQLNYGVIPSVYQYQPPCIPYWPYLTCNTHITPSPRPKINTTQKEYGKQPPCSFQPYWPYTNCYQKESDCSKCYSMPQPCPVVCQNVPIYNQQPLMPFGYPPIPPCLTFNGCNPYFGYGYPMPYFGYSPINYGPIWSQISNRRVPGVMSSPYKTFAGTSPSEKDA